MGAGGLDPRPLVVDVCRSCHLVWFDWAEQERLTGPSQTVSAGEREVDAAIARLQVESQAEVARTEHQLKRGSLVIEVLEAILWW